MTQILYHKQLWSKELCGRNNCLPWLTKPGSCRRSGVTYRVTCLTCKDNQVKTTYIGESHRSLFDRSSEHEAALRSKNQTYAVVKHWEEVHPQMRTPPKYNYQVIKSHKSAFERQVWEAVLINHEEADMVMNGKGEWGMNLVPVLKSHQPEFPDTDKFANTQFHNKRHRDDRVIANHNNINHIQVPNDEFSAQFQQRKRARKCDIPSKQKEGFKFTHHCEGSPILTNSGAWFSSNDIRFGSNVHVNIMRQYAFSFSAVPQVGNKHKVK